MKKQKLTAAADYFGRRFKSDPRSKMESDYLAGLLAVGELSLRFREKFRLTQRQLARQSGVPSRFVSLLEKGRLGFEAPCTPEDRQHVLALTDHFARAYAEIMSDMEKARRSRTVDEEFSRALAASTS